MRFSQNNMLEKTKKYKKIIVVCIVAILFMVISFIFIYQTYIQKIIYEERLNQMDEVTHQMFLNLEDVMETKWDYVKVQCNIIEAADIRTTEDLSLHMKRITDLYEFADSKITLLAVDDSGKYYTEEGNQGMVRDTYHFEHSPKKINYVSNFMTTNESRMVFLKKLEHPIRLQSGQTINYYGLYQDMHELNEYFGCDAYENNNSVYILDDNGFKLFNSNKVELIKGHNVFTVLKKMQYLHDSSFDKAEKELKEKGVSYSNAILDGTEYFYVLKKMDHAAWNLIFLVPAKYVATNTVRLVKLIIWFIILFAVVAAGCMIKGIVTVLRKSQSEAIEIERENNTRLETINTELTQAKRAAEQAFEVANNASQSKSDFLASMSHDIRTPMNAIIGFSDLLEKHADDREKVVEYIGKIKSSSTFLLSLINYVLEMARIESGEAELKPEVGCFKDLVNSLQAVFEPEIHKKNLKYTCILNSDHPYVICDSTKVREILLNIISNSIKYTPDGGSIVVDISEFHYSKEGHTSFRIVVADTGIGMSEEYLPHIFEEFTRERTSTESHVTGTGLGLPIVKALVDLMGGTINVESKVGQGTKTTIVLSFPTATEEQIQSRKEEQSGQILRNFKGKRILLAEDNELNAEIAMELLGESGLETEHVTDGIKCVETLKAKPED